MIFIKKYLNFKHNESSVFDKILCYHKSSLPYLQSFINDGISYENLSSGHGQGSGFYMYSNIDEKGGLDYTIKAGLVAGLRKDLIVRQKILIPYIWNIFKEIILSNKSIKIYSISQKKIQQGRVSR